MGTRTASPSSRATSRAARVDFPAPGAAGEPQDAAGRAAVPGAPGEGRRPGGEAVELLRVHAGHSRTAAGGTARGVHGPSPAPTLPRPSFGPSFAPSIDKGRAGNDTGRRG